MLTAAFMSEREASRNVIQLNFICSSHSAPGWWRCSLYSATLGSHIGPFQPDLVLILLRAWWLNRQIICISSWNTPSSETRSYVVKTCFCRTQTRQVCWPHRRQRNINSEPLGRISRRLGALKRGSSQCKHVFILTAQNILLNLAHRIARQFIKQD